MFGDVVNPSIKVGSRSWYTVPLSILVHTVVIGAVVIIPLMAADVLPTPPSMMAFVAAARRRRPRRRPLRRRHRHRKRQHPRLKSIRTPHLSKRRKKSSQRPESSRV